MLTQRDNAHNAMNSGDLPSALRPARLLGTASALALTLALGVAFTATTPTPAKAVECILDTVNDGVATVGEVGAVTQDEDDLVDHTVAGSDGIGAGTSSPAAAGLACGVDADAFTTTSTAVGDLTDAGNSADDTFTTALGHDADATRSSATALGEGTRASHLRSTAIGADAATRRDENMAFGTASSNYSMPGITSAASKSFQSGPLEVITTDSDGDLASDGGQIFHDISRLRQGVAMAFALPDLTLPSDVRYGLSAGVGLFDGNEALGLKGVVRITNYMQLGVGVAAANGSGTASSVVGGNVAVKFLFK